MVKGKLTERLVDIIFYAGSILTLVTGTLYTQAAKGVLEREELRNQYFEQPLPTYTDYRNSFSNR